MAKREAPQPRRGSDGPSWIAAGVAVLSIVLFMAWLATRREPESVAVVEPGRADTTDSRAADSAATVVTPEELNNAARVNELRGQDVQIERAEVISAMGTQLFWLQLPGGSPFLVKLDSALVAAGTQAPASGHYRIVGRVLEKDDAVLTQWQQAGVLQSDGDRQQAEYGSSYIEARRLQPAGS
jgi:hypothetical protein